VEPVLKPRRQTLGPGGRTRAWYRLDVVEQYARERFATQVETLANKALVRAIVQRDPAISDETISKLLCEGGLKRGPKRRTVAKYRAELGIPGVFERGARAKRSS
jgi:DNA-directed RNA polymerase specialized sigma54-like protein